MKDCCLLACYIAFLYNSVPPVNCDIKASRGSSSIKYQSWKCSIDWLTCQSDAGIFLTAIFSNNILVCVKVKEAKQIRKKPN